MTALRNAVKRKTHKERAQPAGRKKFGLLEKRSDYRLRARDFAAKKRMLGKLKRKAELRNEDEFYFGMVSAETKRGVHVMKRADPQAASGGAAAGEMAQRLDRAYLDLKLTHEKKKLERLKSSLHYTAGASSSSTDGDDGDRKQATRIVFASSSSDEDEEDEGSDDEDVAPSPRPTAASKKAYAALERAQARVETLSHAVEHATLTRNMQSKGRKFKVRDADGNKPAVFRWASERKR